MHFTIFDIVKAPGNYVFEYYPAERTGGLGWTATNCEYITIPEQRDSGYECIVSITGIIETPDLIDVSTDLDNRLLSPIL